MIGMVAMLLVIVGWLTQVGEVYRDPVHFFWCRLKRFVASNKSVAMNLECVFQPWQLFCACTKKKMTFLLTKIHFSPPQKSVELNSNSIP